jgi:hypothetical protein
MRQPGANSHGASGGIWGDAGTIKSTEVQFYRSLSPVGHRPKSLEAVAFRSQRRPVCTPHQGLLPDGSQTKRAAVDTPRCGSLSLARSRGEMAR